MGTDLRFIHTLKYSLTFFHAHVYSPSWQKRYKQSEQIGRTNDFSTRDQLAGTARKHFFGRDDLLLIALDPASLGPALKWEPSRGGALFPHLYADFATASAVWVRELKLRADGEPDIDAALEEPIP